jgi:quinol monooxygenase YgiN
MVIQIVRVSINPEARDAWLDLVRLNAARTRAEEGCEDYRIAVDLEAPDTFVIVEWWASLEAQYDFRRPEFAELMGALPGLLAAPPEVSIHEVSATLSLDEVLAAAGVQG